MDLRLTRFTHSCPEFSTPNPRPLTDVKEIEGILSEPYPRNRDIKGVTLAIYTFDLLAAFNFLS